MPDPMMQSHPEAAAEKYRRERDAARAALEAAYAYIERQAARPSPQLVEQIDRALTDRR